jgi:hypothetical protein
MLLRSKDKEILPYSKKERECERKRVNDERQQTRGPAIQIAEA